MSGNLEQDMINHMRDMLLLEGYADWSDENGKTVAGQHFTMGTLPEAAEHVQTEAAVMAIQIYQAIRAQFKEQSGEQAAEPWACLLGWAYAEERLGDYEEIIESWCHDAVMSAIGHGVSWEDDNSSLVVKKGDGRLVEVRVHSTGHEGIEWEPKEPEDDDETDLELDEIDE